MIVLSRTVFRMLLALLVAVPATAAERTGVGHANACAASDLLTGPCFAVHGRLTLCNGAPSARIWVIGTHRVLGVADAADNPVGDDLLPGGLLGRMLSKPPCSEAAFGDFTVCPLTPERPEVMRHVCVVDSRNLIFQPW